MAKILVIKLKSITMYMSVSKEIETRFGNISKMVNLYGMESRSGLNGKRMGMKWCLKPGRGSDSAATLGDSVLSYRNKMANWRE